LLEACTDASWLADSFLVFTEFPPGSVPLSVFWFPAITLYWPVWAVSCRRDNRKLVAVRFASLLQPCGHLKCLLKRQDRKEVVPQTAETFQIGGLPRM
jgi:hypothetical protein